MVLPGEAKGPHHPRPSLRDHLVDGLSSLPNSFPIGLTVLSSSPKRTLSLYPHAIHPPKCFEKEYLVVVSCTNPTLHPITPTAEPSAESSSSTSQPQSRPVLAVALHAYLYHLPNVDTSILYISKVDTSGYAHTPLPLTRQLVTSFLEYHLSPLSRPSRRVQIALFARSQSQYLFPNSASAPGKRISGGLKLCAWWKGVYEQVVHNFLGRSGTQGRSETEEKGVTVGLRYLLPSYSEEEAKGMLGRGKVDLPDNVEWKYSPPFPDNVFGTTSDSLTLVDGEEEPTRLAWSIPSLPDDPKTRFLEEIVLDAAPRNALSRDTNGSSIPTIPTTENGTGRSIGKTDSEATIVSTSSTSKKDKSEAERRRQQAALDRIDVAEFWERMGFRQECSSGDVTGFFHLDSQSSPAASYADPSGSSVAPTELPIMIVDRIHQSLLNCDFANEPFALENSELWLKSTEALVKDELGEEGWSACTATIAAKENIQSVGIKRKDEGINVLQIKKKPKKNRPA